MSERYLPPLTAFERERFITAARAYLHVRWRHQGRSKAGVDCAGMLVCAMRDIGKPPLDSADYGRYPRGQQLQALLRANCGDPLPAADPMQSGDVVLMQFKGEPSHLGVLTGYPLGGFGLLHAFAQNRKVVEHRLDDQWRDRIVEAYRP